MKKFFLIPILIISLKTQNFNNTNKNTQNNNQNANLDNKNSFFDLIDLTNTNDVQNQNHPRFQNFANNVNDLTLSPSLASSHFNTDLANHDSCFWRCSAHYWNCHTATPFNECKWKLWKCYDCIKKSRFGCKPQCAWL